MCVANTCASGRWAGPAARPDAARRTRGTAAAALLVLVAAAWLPAPTRATTKGLSQIVTPDLQEAGQLTVSGQAQESAIGNPWQLQAELGLTDWAEVAAFQGFSPNERWQLNPAVYRDNGAGHALRGYFVASYSLQLWQR